jgi:ubiquinone/menaquinone biosynthesis C-methylase UbiE
LEAGLSPGEQVLDLGSGLGIECFIAAPLVGARGRVYGVDMLEAMLSRARAGAAEVAANLGFDNLEFKNGYLESLPLAPQSVDVVLSNCVINLSAHKRRTFAEIFRVGPRRPLIIADVVCDTERRPLLKIMCGENAWPADQRSFWPAARVSFTASTFKHFHTVRCRDTSLFLDLRR